MHALLWLLTAVPVPVALAGSPLKATYAESVATILNEHCVECHRPNQVAPFSLIGYDNAKKWAPMIVRVTESKQMPPWKAAEGFGAFAHENRLEPSELATLKAWTNAGAPRGPKAKEPKQPSFKSEWTLGTPDLILEPSREFKLEAEGQDVYRNFVIPTNFDKVVWVRAIDVRPGNRAVVHHVIAYLDKSNRGKALEARTNDGQPGYLTFGGPGFLPSGSLGGWAPGVRPYETPRSIAFKVEPGETIVMQVHYHKSGKPETDRTKLALYFAKEPVEKPLTLAWLANPLFRIPAGAKTHPVNLTRTIPTDLTLYSVMPHMHLLGKQMRAELEYPDGKRKPLIWIKDWDFNWQLNYALKEPIFVPKGSKIHVSAIYDNSTENPNQPANPPRAVTWGEETTDEMFLMIASYTLANQADAHRMRTFGAG